MNRSRYLVLPITLLGVCLILFPLAESLISTYPFRGGDPQWRFGVEGLVMGSLFFPLVGLVCLLAAATLADSTRSVSAVFWVSLAMMIGTVLAVGAFLLDTLQVKSGVAPAVLPAFERASASAALRAAFASVVMAGCAVAARRINRAERSGHSKASRTSTPIVGMTGVGTEKESRNSRT